MLPWNRVCVGRGKVRGARQTNGLGVGLEDARVNKLHKQEVLGITNSLLSFDTTWTA
jgi:hypothetical protein